MRSSESKDVSQLTAVDRLRRDVHNLEVMHLSNAADRRQREVEHVLVVDLVHGALVENGANVRIFKNEKP